MTVREDRRDFESTGLQGLLRQLMASADEGFVRVLPGGWRGEIVAARPGPGTGPFILYRRGSPLLMYRNSTADDAHVQEYRLL
jgi:hypothetical protein